MSLENQNNASMFGNHYGLALEEIQLKRSINALNAVLNSFDTDNLPEYLIDEKSYLERQLKSLRGITIGK